MIFAGRPRRLSAAGAGLLFRAALEDYSAAVV